MKIILIKTCNECPFRSTLPSYIKTNHEGVSRIPYCNHVSRELPFVLAKKTTEPTAAPTNIIPDWCPLEEVDSDD